jgi:HPt (histidine-containing phosphotransfer) domain-containing protein
LPKKLPPFDKNISSNIVFRLAMTSSTTQLIKPSHRPFLKVASDRLQTLETTLSTLRTGFTVQKVQHLVRTCQALNSISTRLELAAMQQASQSLEEVFEALCHADKGICAEVESQLNQSYDCLKRLMTLRLVDEALAQLGDSPPDRTADEAEILFQLDSIIADLKVMLSGSSSKPEPIAYGQPQRQKHDSAIYIAATVPGLSQTTLPPGKPPKGQWQQKAKQLLHNLAGSSRTTAANPSQPDSVQPSLPEAPPSTVIILAETGFDASLFEEDDFTDENFADEALADQSPANQPPADQAVTQTADIDTAQSSETAPAPEVISAVLDSESTHPDLTDFIPPQLTAMNLLPTLPLWPTATPQTPAELEAEQTELEALIPPELSQLSETPESLQAQAEVSAFFEP